MSEQLQVEVGQRTDVGMKCRINEDSFAIPDGIDPELLAEKGRLYIVADGLGGYEAGKMASDLAVNVVMQAYYATPSGDVERALRQAIQLANTEIYRQAHQQGYEKTSTTIVAAVIRGETLTVANVGDSRAYLLRGARIRRITEDHTWAEEQIRGGLMTSEEARAYQYRHVLTRSLGSEKKEVEIDIFEEPLQRGDAILLCSDGLSGQVRDHEMRKIVAANHPQRAASLLVDLANERGGPDNVTAMVIEVVGGRRRLAVPKREREAAEPSPARRSASAVQFVLAGAAAILLALIIAVWLANRLLAITPPTEPPPVVVPLEYVVRSGDTGQAIAGLLQAEPMQIPSESLSPGQVLRVTPSRYGFYFSGLVEDIRAAPSGEGYVLQLGSLDLDGSPYTWEVTCAASRARAGNKPATGDLAVVFGYPQEDGSVDAIIVDVAKDNLLQTVWQNWFYADEGQPVWVYTSFSEFTLGTDSEYALKRALVRGTWAKGKVAYLNYEESDLYLLDSQRRVYVSATNPRPAPTPTVAPGATLTIEPAPTATAALIPPTPTVVPTDTPAPPGFPKRGTVSAGTYLYREANEKTGLMVLPAGSRVEVLGEVQGEAVFGSDRWYKVRYEGQEGFAPKALIEVE